MILIKNFSQHNESKVNIAKMSKLIKPSDQEIEDAEKYLEQGSDPTWDLKDGYFYVDITGRYSVYYTLWKANLNNADRFITNLSTDFQTAIQKAKKAAGRIPIEIDRTGTKAGLFNAAKLEILSFGKYREKTLGDIFVEDPKYIIYLSQNLEGKSKEWIEKIQYYKDLYFETIRKKNQEESISQFVGKIGDKITIEAYIYDVKETRNDYNGKVQYECKLKDDDGNKYKTYNIGNNPVDITKSVKVGDDITLTAKVKDHKEWLGVKFTLLYFCKITRLSNIKEDMAKYNM